MLIGAAEDTHRRFVRIEPVGDDSLRMNSRVLQQSLENFDRSGLVAALLNEHVENFAFVIDDAPKIHPHAANLHDHLVEMKTRRRLGAAPTEVPSELLSELQCPDADGFVAQFDPALGEEFLDVRMLSENRK